MLCQLSYLAHVRPTSGGELCPPPAARAPDGLRSRDLRLDSAFERVLKPTASSCRVAFALLKRWMVSRMVLARPWVLPVASGGRTGGKTGNKTGLALSDALG